VSRQNKSKAGKLELADAAMATTSGRRASPLAPLMPANAHEPRRKGDGAHAKHPISNFILKRANEPLWNLTFNSLSSFGKIA
jgi:hypothetical protein